MTYLIDDLKDDGLYTPIVFFGILGSIFLFWMFIGYVS